MQSFLPFPDYRTSARVLDTKRQGKQRVEGLQILHNLLGKRVEDYATPLERVVDTPPGQGWTNHPIVLMWENNVVSLAIYTIIMCEEWQAQGYNDSIKGKIEVLIPGIRSDWTAKHPIWLGDPDFHQSHRSNLIRKHPSWYRDRLGWNDPDNLDYIWPRG